MTIIAAVGMTRFVGSAFCADFPTMHHLFIGGSETKKTFTAKIDERKFNTLTTLEEYLATLPAGDGVSCRYDTGKIGQENPDGDQLRRTLFILKEFCKDHHIRSGGGGSST